MRNPLSSSVSIQLLERAEPLHNQHQIVHSVWGSDRKLVQNLTSRFQPILEKACGPVTFDSRDFIKELPIMLGILPEHLGWVFPHLGQGLWLLCCLIAGDETSVKRSLKLDQISDGSSGQFVKPLESKGAETRGECFALYFILVSTEFDCLPKVDEVGVGFARVGVKFVEFREVKGGFRWLFKYARGEGPDAELF